MAKICIAFAFLLVCFAARAADGSTIPYEGDSPYLLPKRFALVVGIENYNGGGRLNIGTVPGVRKDQENVAKMLTAIGFEVRELISQDDHKYIGKDEIRQAVQDLATDAEDAKKQTGRGAIVLVYYAGHGLTYGDDSYILPSTFSASVKDDIPQSGLSVDYVLTLLSTADPTLKIVVLDTCRTQPPANLPALGASTIGGSLAGIHKPKNWGLGTDHAYLLFSTLRGDPAKGNALRGGRFTNILVSLMKQKLKWVQDNPTFANKPTLNEIYEILRTEMMSSGSGAQIADKNDQFAAPFFLFPTKYDFGVEKQTYESIENMPTAAFKNFDEMELRRICDFRQMLEKFSQYSYYSKKIIGKVRSFADGDDRDRGCLGDDLVMAPGRSVDGQWNFPAGKADPSSSPASKDGPTPRQDGTLLDQGSCPGRLRPDGACLIESRAERRRVRYAELGSAPRGISGDGTERADESLSQTTFGDLRRSLGRSGFKQQGQENWPADDVLLNTAVVTKLETGLREQADPASRLKGAIPAGEFLEVVGTTPRRTWLKVKHRSLGEGYVAGELVEPALATITKSVSFEENSFELSEHSKLDLAASLGALGGIVVIDASTEYSDGGGKLGFVRAVRTRSFLTDLLVGPDKSNSGFGYIGIKENKAAVIKPDEVRIKAIVVPLDRKMRSTIAAAAGTKASGGVDIKQTNPDLIKGTPIGDLTKNPIVLCAQNGTCKSPPNVVDGPKYNAGMNKLRDQLKYDAESIGSVGKNLSVFKF